MILFHFDNPLTLFCALVFAHALADFPLQGDFLSKFKNPLLAVENPKAESIWMWALSYHCIIHAGFVWMLTGIWWLGLIEFCLHWILDFLKGMFQLPFGGDQVVHLLCKAGYCFGIWVASLLFK